MYMQLFFIWEGEKSMTNFVDLEDPIQKKQILSASCNKIYVHLFYLNKKIKNMATFVNIKVFSCLRAGKYAFCHFKVPMQKQASFFN